MSIYTSQPPKAVSILNLVIINLFISQASSAFPYPPTQMISLRCILQFFFAPAISSPLNTPKIQWGACNETEVNSTLPIKCANLNVPLGYTEPTSNATLNLELARVPAAFQPSKGSILFNFGGPGATGRDNLALLGPLLQL